MTVWRHLDTGKWLKLSGKNSSRVTYVDDTNQATVISVPPPSEKDKLESYKVKNIRIIL